MYLDEIPLNDPFGGSVSLTSFPSFFFESIELYRFPPILGFVDSFLGGALNIHTFSEVEQKKVFFYSSFNSLISGTIAGFLSLPHIQQYLLVEGSLNKYSYVDNNQTTLINKEDDSRVFRENNDFVHLNYFTTSNWSINNIDFNLFVYYDFKDQGLPGVLGLETLFVSYQAHTSLIRFKIQKEITPSFFTFVYFSFYNLVSNLEDEQNELSLGFTELERIFFSAELAWGGRWQIIDSILSIGCFSDVRATPLYQEQELFAVRLSGELAGEIRYQVLPWLGSFSIQSKGQILLDRLFVTEILVHNDGAKWDYQIFPTVAGVFVLNILDVVRHHISKDNTDSVLWSISFDFYIESAYGVRAPSFTERYGDGQLLLPNINLKEETGFTQTVGLQFLLQNVLYKTEFFINYYVRLLSDLITVLSNSQRTSIALNISEASVHGFESMFLFGYSSYLDLSIRYTYTYAKDVGDITFYTQKFLPYIPLHSANIYLSAGVDQFRSFLDILFSGHIYRDRYNSNELFTPSQLNISVGSTWYITEDKKYSVSLILRNLVFLDQLDYVGYPLPGTVLEVQFRMILD